jgi:hypothetical protein
MSLHDRPLSGRFILIIEDEPLIALEVHATFNAAGASITSAADTQDALRMIDVPGLSAAVVDMLCNGAGAKGVGHRRWVGSTGNGMSPTFNGRRREPRQGRLDAVDDGVLANADGIAVAQRKGKVCHKPTFTRCSFVCQRLANYCRIFCAAQDFGVMPSRPRLLSLASAPTDG